MKSVALKTELKLLLVAGVLIIAGAAAAAEAPVVYGRAGMAVGAERIAQIGRTANLPSTRDFSKWHGNAGGPVGADAIEQIAKAPSTPVPAGIDFAGWYGRAGGPVGVDAVKRYAPDTQMAQRPGSVTVVR